MTLGTVMQNRITRRFRRVCALSGGWWVLREVRRDGWLGDGAICLPKVLVWLLYRRRPDLVAPWEGSLRPRAG